MFSGLNKKPFIVSSTINILGYLPNTVNEYVKYSLDKTRSKLYQKLNDVPAENIVSPPVHIAAPTLQAACYAADCDELHNMFATLLATAMNSEKQALIHPAFIELIKQLSPLEAKVLSNESFINSNVFPMCTIRLQAYNSAHPLGLNFRIAANGKDIHKNIANYEALEEITDMDLSKISSISDNLSRLQIIVIHEDSWLLDSKQYSKLLAIHKSFVDKQTSSHPGQEFAFIPIMAEKTAFGRQFFQACIL